MRKRKTYKTRTDIKDLGIKIGMYVQTVQNIVGEVVKYNEKYGSVTLRELDGRVRDYKPVSIKVVLTEELNPEYFL